MYDTIGRNMRKRKKITGTWFLETTTMFQPGAGSVAELTFDEAEAIREGRKRGRSRLLYDHRWGEISDLTDEPALRAALREAFGDAMSWQDEDGLVDEFYSTRTKVKNSRRYFLNAQTSSSDAWIAAHEWEACGNPTKLIKPKELVFMGFDGSKRDDASSLVIATQDGRIELVGLWEKPEDEDEESEWSVDTVAVDAAVFHTFSTYEVAGFYADPAGWQDHLDRWTREFGSKLKVRASKEKPIEFWTNRPKVMAAALERFLEAVLDQTLGFVPAEHRAGEQMQYAAALKRHALNARRRPSRSGLQIAKPTPKSRKKIDAVMAAVLAYECAQDSVGQGVKSQRSMAYAAKRLR